MQQTRSLSLPKEICCEAWHSANRFARFKSKKSKMTGRLQSVAESISSGVWDDKYIKEFGELKYATTLLQGNR